MKDLTIISTVEITEVIKDFDGDELDEFAYKRNLATDLLEIMELDKAEVKQCKVFVMDYGDDNA